MSVTVSMAVTAPYCFLFSASIFLAITLLEILRWPILYRNLFTNAPECAFNGAELSTSLPAALHCRNLATAFKNPVTGELWNNENGPNGGDEINIILPGKNYGWPVISFGREYTGPRVSEHPTREGM